MNAQSEKAETQHPSNGVQKKKKEIKNIMDTTGYNMNKPQKKKKSPNKRNQTQRITYYMIIFI